MKIVGVFWGAWVGMFPEENKKNFEELFKLHSEGKINPEVSDSFSLDDGAKAIAPHIEAAVEGNASGEPKTVIFLTCDLTGLIPL